MAKNTKNHFMDLNHETAMRLWVKQFGKEVKVKDFSGREIIKGAYNQRTSDYGWNVDHILPQSQGGKTADYNLICCHIKTNDEKADKFPCFVANDKRFEILKCENHYEIKLVSTNNQNPTNFVDKENLYDFSSGIRLINKLSNIKEQSRFVGTVFINLINIKSNAVIEFIEEIFDEENVEYTTSNYPQKSITITLRNYNLPLKEDTSNLLEKCILLNTYLSSYFKPIGQIQSYSIIYRVDCFKTKQDMYDKINKIDFNTSKQSITYYGNFESYLTSNNNDNLKDSLFINNLVHLNTEAKTNMPNCTFKSDTDYKKYNYIFTELSKNLKKEVSGK